MTGIRTFGKELSRLPEQLPPELRGPDWVQANPVLIEEHLHRALALPTGGWFAIDASSAITSAPRPYRIAGHELVAWRLDGALRVAPDACPHMGARLSDGHVREGRLVCPWHGLELSDDKYGAWCPFEAHDDGVLAWVRLPEEGQEPSARPILSARPEAFLDSVMRMEANCEPRDVIANRLDPWHGVHYHPHTFKRLRVIGIRDDRLVVRVIYGISDRMGIEVDATFHCPDPRTITMTIVDGEGTGSVVETHATPLGPGRTAILEATLATSERSGFRRALKAAGIIRPLILKAQRRLWVEDAAYAERTYELRRSSARGELPDGSLFNGSRDS
jgi:isorenieratene synthase